jgi:beta-glucosidase
MIMLLSKSDFGNKFTWGVSTAAYQIEGGHDLDSKGKSIWDVFVKQRNRIFQNHTGDKACDFYNRFSKDLCLMRMLNIFNHRFSISWSRILPNGTGKINRNGIDFYNRLIDFSLELGITPWITLYHWDLPYDLEKKGGWVNREIVHWFQNYISICVKYFGDRVNNWIILNEPMVFTGAGYFLGVHAPGKKGLNNFLAATHHAALAQSCGARVIKSVMPQSNEGTTFSCSHIQPFSNDEKDLIAAKKVDALLNRSFIEPLLGFGYPYRDLPILKRIEKFVKQGDEKDLAFDMDFVGLQNYTREIVRHAAFIPFLRAQILKANKRNVEITSMNWEVYPEAIYHVLKKFSAYKNIPDLMITENGAAFKDEVKDGKVDDLKRISFLEKNIEQVLRAKREGVNVCGYFVWTFLDNFEWAEGYYPRFGLVYVDFETQKRIVKSSGYWYADFLS